MRYSLWSGASRWEIASIRPRRGPIRSRQSQACFQGGQVVPYSNKPTVRQYCSWLWLLRLREFIQLCKPLTA